MQQVLRISLWFDSLHFCVLNSLMWNVDDDLAAVLAVPGCWNPAATNIKIGNKLINKYI